MNPFRMMFFLFSFRFLRFQKEYQPPPNAHETLISIAKSKIDDLKNVKEEEAILSYPFPDARTKFELLSAAFVEFKHAIPNSILYRIKCIGMLRLY